MGKHKLVKLGLYIPSYVLNRARSSEELMEYISGGKNMHGKILIALKEYLTEYSKVFDEAQVILTGEISTVLPNGTFKGLKRMLNAREIDIAVQPAIMHESNMKIADFSYPFQMTSATFVVRKPDYKPEIFGILKTFSWQLWIAVFSVLIAMSVVYYVGFKKKCPLNT